MSKNIIIQEGGVGKQITASKLKTNAVGSGSVIWIPEDEVSLGTKSITSNGTYKASDDGKYGYSQVTVNIAGGPGSANPDGTPSSGGGTPASDPTGDTPTGDNGSPAGGPGSCVVGTDPITGNEQAVGVDSSGNLVTTPIPSSIEIVRNPDNTSYQDGSPVDLTGATVIAKNADGSTWTSEDYPDGIIPISDLILETPTADATKTSRRTAGGFTVLDDKRMPEELLESTPDKMRGPGTANFHGIEITVPKGTGVGIAARNPDNDRNIGAYSMFGYYSNTEIGFYAIENEWGYALGFTAVLNNSGTNGPIGSLSYLFGELEIDQGGRQPVSLKWSRPADQKDLKTTFNITVNGSGYSDDSGGSGTGG